MQSGAGPRGGGLSHTYSSRALAGGIEAQKRKERYKARLLRD